MMQVMLIFTLLITVDDTLMEPAAIKPLAIVTGVAAGAFVAEDFLLG